MAARLKVFRTSNGLTESVVAVSSKAKALEAWGTKQDLFKEGLARETDDPAAFELALSRPGEVVTRSALQAGALDTALAALPKTKKDKAKLGKAEKKRGPSREALERVGKLEGKLADHDRRQQEALEDIARRRAALDDEERQLRGTYAAKRRDLEQRLSAARDAVAAES